MVLPCLRMGVSAGALDDGETSRFRLLMRLVSRLADVLGD